MTYTPCDYCGDSESGNTYQFNTIAGQKIVCFTCIRKLVNAYEKYKLVMSYNVKNLFDGIEESSSKKDMRDLDE